MKNPAARWHWAVIERKCQRPAGEFLKDRLRQGGSDREVFSALAEEMLERRARDITLSRLLGEKDLATWIDRFGFGKPTGIDFPGESPGQVASVDKWYGSIAADTKGKIAKSAAGLNSTIDVPAVTSGRCPGDA